MQLLALGAARQGRVSHCRVKTGIVADEPDYSLALEEARRGFDTLVSEIDLVRGRALSVIGMGGLAASFLGGLNIGTNGDITWLTILAVIAFVAMSALCVAMLLPRRVHLTQRPSALVAWAETESVTTADMERDLALWLENKYDENRPALDRLLWLATLASVSFLVEVAALVTDLIAR